MSVKIRRLFEKICGENFKMSLLIFLLVFGIQNVKREEIHKETEENKFYNIRFVVKSMVKLWPILLYLIGWAITLQYGDIATAHKWFNNLRTDYSFFYFIGCIVGLALASLFNRVDQKRE